SVAGGDVDGLGGEGFEVDFNARVGGVPEGAVEKALGAEVGAKVAVEAGEDVAVEGGGDALGVVVGGEQGGDRFAVAVGGGGWGEVGAEEEGVADFEFGPEAG